MPYISGFPSFSDATAAVGPSAVHLLHCVTIVCGTVNTTEESQHSHLPPLVI